MVRLTYPELMSKRRKKMYQKIMAPLDGSELAECVLPHIESIAKGCSVKSVVLVSVVDPATFPSSGVYEHERIRIESHYKSASGQYLRQVASRLEYDGADLETEVIVGKAPESLAEYAEKNDVDLIIIATHGRSGISRWAWGSVADRILRSACVPVLMVRAPGCVPGI